LTFFLALPFLLQRWTFVPSLLTATLIMFVSYGLMLLVMQWVQSSGTNAPEP
jgi:protein-S-isoprenylcysteine O-methyltransferase Ste14